MSGKERPFWQQAAIMAAVVAAVAVVASLIGRLGRMWLEGAG